MCAHARQDENVRMAWTQWENIYSRRFFVCVYSCRMEVNPAKSWGSRAASSLLIHREVTNSSRRFPTLPYLLIVFDKLCYWRGLFSWLTAGGMRKEGETERQKQKRSEPNVLFVQTRMEHSPGLVRLSAARYSRFARQIKNSGRPWDKLLWWACGKVLLNIVFRTRAPRYSHLKVIDKSLHLMSNINSRWTKILSLPRDEFIAS